MKAVIAAGGFSTRFLPTSKAIPKEMLPLQGKPMIQHQLEMLLDAGIDQVIIVVRRGADIIHNYFERDIAVEEHIGPQESERLFGALRRIRRNMLIAYTHEIETWPYGDANPLMAARPWLGNDPFYVLWVDDVVIGAEPVPNQLARIYDRAGMSVVSSQSVAQDESRYYGSVNMGPDGLVLGMGSKEAGTFAHVGHFLFTHEIFDAIDQCLVGSRQEGEMWIGDALQHLIRQKHLYGCQITGKWLDAGDLKRYFRASLIELEEGND